MQFLHVKTSLHFLHGPMFYQVKYFQSKKISDHEVKPQDGFEILKKPKFVITIMYIRTYFQ